MPESLISARPAIKVDGEVNDDMQESLTSLVINLPLSGIAHGELVLTNWGSTGEPGEMSQLFQNAGLGKTIDVSMGADDERPVFKGEITALEERYGNGSPQLIVLVQDKLHRLARRRQSRAYDEMTPDDIVQAIAGEAGLTADTNVSTVTSTFHQINESDLAFLMRLLGYFDIAVRLEENTLRARPEEADPQPVELSPLDSAMAVRLIADLNHQHGSTKVMGFNPGAGEPVEHAAAAIAPPPGGTTAYDTLGELGWPVEEIVAQPFPTSNGHADAFAQGHFNRLAKRFISGEIRCKGEPSMRSGREIELSGVSERMAGLYQVVHCVHRFDNASGFETHLKVNRGGWTP